MFEETPFSLCGWYLPEHSGMIQTFKLSEVNCKNCIREVKKAVSSLLNQYAKNKNSNGHINLCQCKVCK